MTEQARARRRVDRVRSGRRPRATGAVLTLALLASACASASGSTSAPSGGDGLVSIGARLMGPVGLEASVYTTGLRNVSAFAFDARDRLWVATSAATDHTNDGVYLVEGQGATPVEVISGVRGPLGLLWRGDTLYVASVGRVDTYSGLKGTRFAHHRTILHGPLAGAANAGLVLTPGGRILMSVSTTCDHCVPSSTWAATIVSFRPDGTDLRIYATGVRDAFGLTLYPGTSDLFATINQRDDLGTKTPADSLAVVNQDDDLGFPDCYGQAGAACAGVPEPTAELDPHAGAGGVAIVTGQLGPSVGTSALVSDWALGKVQRVALTRSGSTYTGTVTTFLTGLKDPLPVAVTPDGALLVGDWSTGSIYLIAGA